MKTITYSLTDGSKKAVEYDEAGLCMICDLPVMEVSMSGTDVCPWCDCGTFRNGKKWTSMNPDKIRREAKMN